MPVPEERDNWTRDPPHQLTDIPSHIVARCHTQNKYDVYIVAPNTYWTMTPLLASAASECSTNPASSMLIDPMLTRVAALPPSAGSLEFRNVVGKSDLSRPISKIGRPPQKAGKAQLGRTSSSQPLTERRLLTSCSEPIRESCDKAYYYHAWCDSIDFTQKRVHLTPAYPPAFQSPDPAFGGSEAGQNVSRLRGPSKDSMKSSSLTSHTFPLLTTRAPQSPIVAEVKSLATFACRIV
jgi:hypothetical protein